MGLTTSYSEAKLRGITGPIEGQANEVHTTQKNALGARALDQFDNEYVYLKGVASTVEGMAVTFDEAGVTTLLAANAVGPVAWATAAIDATTKFGWYATAGAILGRVVTATADNAQLGRETTDGEIGDGFAAGDAIRLCVARAANASGSTVLQKIQTAGRPYVEGGTFSS